MRGRDAHLLLESRPQSQTVLYLLQGDVIWFHLKQTFSSDCDIVIWYDLALTYHHIMTISKMFCKWQYSNVCQNVIEQECWSILQHRDWSNDQHKSHFEVKKKITKLSKELSHYQKRHKLIKIVIKLSKASSNYQKSHQIIKSIVKLSKASSN